MAADRRLPEPSTGTTSEDNPARSAAAAEAFAGRIERHRHKLQPAPRARDTGDWRLMATNANRSPAAACYLRRSGGPQFSAFQERRTAGSGRRRRRGHHVLGEVLFGVRVPGGAAVTACSQGHAPVTLLGQARPAELTAGLHVLAPDTALRCDANWRAVFVVDKHGSLEVRPASGARQTLSKGASRCFALTGPVVLHAVGARPVLSTVSRTARLESVR